MTHGSATYGSTDTHLANKQLVREIFDALSQGDSKPLVQSMADDFRWVITGQTSWSRTFVGKQEVIAQLFGALRGVLAGRIRTTASRFVAEDDCVVVQARGSNTTHSGKPYNNEYCYVIRVVDGKLKELIEYADTELFRTALGEPLYPA
jgi:ketosteroid isomerase-like protein